MHLVAALDRAGVTLAGSNGLTGLYAGHGDSGSSGDRWWCTPRSWGGDRKESKEEHRENGGINTSEHIDDVVKMLRSGRRFFW